MCRASWAVRRSPSAAVRPICLRLRHLRRTAIACRRRLSRSRFDAVGSRGARPDRQDSRRKFQFASRHDRDFDTFSAALARNSKGIDTILAGLEKHLAARRRRASAHIRSDCFASCRCTLSKSPAKSLWSQIRRRPRSQERHAKNHCRRKRRTKLVLGQCAMGR